MKNKNGFTLVELLAVIVVLALLMVVAASSIGSSLTNSKKVSLRTEAQKLLNSAYRDINLNVTPDLSLLTQKGNKYVFTLSDQNFNGYAIFNSGFEIVEYCLDLDKELVVYADGITVTGKAPEVSETTTIEEAKCCKYKEEKDGSNNIIGAKIDISSDCS